jgi:thiol-disulfide isomerase/thioredoxin
MLSRIIFPLLLIVCLIISTASCQEENRKPPVFDNATTVEQVETQLQDFAQELRKTAKDEQSFKNYLQTMGDVVIAGGEKVLKIAKNDEELEKGYMMKISGFKMLIAVDRYTSSKKSEYQDKLSTLFDEIEKEGKFPLLVNGERYLEFMRELEQGYEDLTPEKFEQIKKDIRQWVNKNPFPFEPIEPLKTVLRFAESEKLSQNDSNFVAKTVRELTAFVNSADCTIPDEKKKETVQSLEGYSRRCVGADLKLYGKTLGNQDFNWEALRGKYVLVKFTASWCGPCKGEIPGMLKAYEQYHDKGLEIVSVYVWDKLADVQHAVEEEKLPWMIVSEELTEKANQPPQGKIYCIEGVPTMLLVDKDGKVMGTDVRGQELQTRLAKLFPKK